MSTKLIALACVVAAGAVTAFADAGHGVTKQRVAIEHKGSTFVLTPLTTGAVKPDKGSITFCCWTEHNTIRDGEAIDINDPQMTLTGKLGTLVARNRIGYVDIYNGWSIFTGTWTVVSGTGQYAGLTGGGRGAGIAPPTGDTKASFEGFLTQK
jgi:hypothetical protein